MTQHGNLKIEENLEELNLTLESVKAQIAYNNKLKREFIACIIKMLHNEEVANVIHLLEQWSDSIADSESPHHQEGHA